jgi:hypothetical protein
MQNVGRNAKTKESLGCGEDRLKDQHFGTS